MNSDNQPSTSNKSTENKTQNIMYPVSLNDFVKLTNCDELVVKEMERAGPEVYRKHHKKRHKYYQKLYELFYSNQASRDKMFRKGLVIKPMPMSLRDKLMKMPGDQSVDPCTKKTSHEQKSPVTPPVEQNNNKAQRFSIKKDQQLATEKNKTSTNRTSINGKATVKPLVDEIQKITNFFIALKEPTKPNIPPKTYERKRKSEPPFGNTQPQDKRLKVSNPKVPNTIQNKSQKIKENKKKPTRKDTDNISNNFSEDSPTNVQIVVDVAVPIAEDSHDMLCAKEVVERLKTRAKPKVSTCPELKKSRSEVNSHKSNRILQKSRRKIWPINTTSDDSDIRSISQKAEDPDPDPDSDVCFVPCTPATPVKSPLPKINRQENYKAHSPSQNKLIEDVQKLEEHQQSPSEGELGLRVSEISVRCEIPQEGLSRKEIHSWIEKGQKEFNAEVVEDCDDDSLDSYNDEGNTKVPRLEAMKNYTKQFKRYTKYMIGLDKQKRKAGSYQPTIAEGSKRSEVIAAILNMTFEEYKLLLNIDKGAESSDLKLQYESIVNKKVPWPRKGHIKFTVLRSFLKTKGIRLPLKLIDIPPMLLNFEDVLQHTNLKQCTGLSCDKRQESYHLLEECRKRYRKCCKERIWMEDMQLIHNENQSEAQETEAVLLDSQPTLSEYTSVPPLRVISSDLRSTVSVSFDETCNATISNLDMAFKRPEDVCLQRSQTNATGPAATNQFDTICNDELECELERIFAEDYRVNTYNDNQRINLPSSTTEEVNPPSSGEVACISIDNSPDSVEDLLNNIIQPTPMENPTAKSQSVAKCITSSPNLFPSSGESEPVAKDSQQIATDVSTPEAVYISCNRIMNINTEENNITALSLDATSDNLDPFADMTVACHEIVVTTDQQSLDLDVVVKQELLTERINTSFCENDDSVQIIDVPPSEAIVIDDEETAPELLDILLNTDRKSTRVTACASINMNHVPSSISLENFPQAQQLGSNFSITQSGLHLTQSQAKDVLSKLKENENDEVDVIPPLCTTQEFIQLLKEDSNESFAYKKSNHSPPTGSLEDVTYVHIAPQSIPSNIELTQSGTNQAVNSKKAAAGETVVSNSVESQESSVSIYVYQSNASMKKEDVMSDGTEKPKTPGNVIGVYSIGGPDDLNRHGDGICIIIEDDSGRVELTDVIAEDEMQAVEMNDVEEGAIEPIAITEKDSLEETLEGLLKCPEDHELLEGDIDNAVQRFRMSTTGQRLEVISAENRNEVILGKDLGTPNIQNAMEEDIPCVECLGETEDDVESGKGVCEVRHNAVVTVLKIHENVIEVHSKVDSEPTPAIDVPRGNQQNKNSEVLSQDVNEIPPGCLKRRRYPAVMLKRVKLTKVASNLSENFRNDVENIDLAINESSLLEKGDIQPNSTSEKVSHIVEESTEKNAASDSRIEVLASEVTQVRKTKIVHNIEGEDMLLTLVPEKQSTRDHILAEADATKDLSRVASERTQTQRKDKEYEILEGDIQPEVVLKIGSQRVEMSTEDPKDGVAALQQQYLYKGKLSDKIHESTISRVNQCQKENIPLLTDSSKDHQSIEVSEEANKEALSVKIPTSPVAQENEQTEGSIDASTKDDISSQCQGTETHRISQRHAAAAAENKQLIEDARNADERGEPMETLIEPSRDVEDTVKSLDENVAASTSGSEPHLFSVLNIQELQSQPLSVSNAQASRDHLETNVVSAINAGKCNEIANDGGRVDELAKKGRLSSIIVERMETCDDGDMVSPVVVQHSCEFVELPNNSLNSIEGNELQEEFILESDLRQTVECVGFFGRKMQEGLLEINDKKDSMNNPKISTTLADDEANDERADNVLTTVQVDPDEPLCENQMSCASDFIESSEGPQKIATVNVESSQSIEISTKKSNRSENLRKTLGKNVIQTSPGVETTTVTQPLQEPMSKELVANRFVEAIVVCSKLLHRNNQQLESQISAHRNEETLSIEDVAQTTGKSLDNVQTDTDSSSSLNQSCKTTHSKENVPQNTGKDLAAKTLKSFSNTANQIHTPQPRPIDIISTDERPTAATTFIFPAQLPNPAVVNKMEEEELVEVPFLINTRLWNSLPLERISTTTGIKIKFEIPISESTKLSSLNTAAGLEKQAKQLVDETSDQMISKMHIPGLTDLNSGDHFAQLSDETIWSTNSSLLIPNQNNCFYNADLQTILNDMVDVRHTKDTREQMLNEDATRILQNCHKTDPREPTDDLKLQTETNLIVIDDACTFGVNPSPEESGVLEKAAECDSVPSRCSAKLNFEALVNEIFIDAQTTSKLTDPTSISGTNLTQVQPLVSEVKSMKQALCSQNKKSAYLERDSHSTSTTTDDSPASGAQWVERQSNVTLRKKPKDLNQQLDSHITLDMPEKMSAFGTAFFRVQPLVSEISTAEPKSIAVSKCKKITSSKLDQHSDVSQTTMPTKDDAPNSITLRKKRNSPKTNLNTPQDQINLKTNTSPTKRLPATFKVKTVPLKNKSKPTAKVDEQVVQTRSKQNHSPPKFICQSTNTKQLPQQKPGPKSKQKSQPPRPSKKPLIPDFVPQLTHAFQPLPLVTGGKKPTLPSETGLPDMPSLTIDEDIDYRIDDASHILPSSSTASQILGTDCTYFENSQLLRNIDEHCAAIVTRNKKSPKPREKPKVKLLNQPSLPASITTLSDGIMARKVWKVHLQWKSPQKMSIETRYITNGRWLSSYDDSAKLMFNFSPATWRNVHTVLKEIDQFEYRRMAVKEKKHTKVVTPLHRVLRGLFDSAPQVINARLIDDTHSPYTRCERATPVYRKPFQCLTKGIPVDILNRMKALKEDLGNNNGNE